MTFDLRSNFTRPAVSFAIFVVMFASGCDRREPVQPEAGPPGTVTFTGGHDIGDNDYGRPVVLIAAALEVEPDVFRQAFSGVTPARGGSPSSHQAQENKAALMSVLAPHGVTNERLDEVSNYYRFRPQRGELWPTTDAQAHAVIEGGHVTKIIVTAPGSGYSSVPTMTVDGFSDIQLKADLALSTDMEKNGAIEAIEVVAGP